ncbi:MAG: UvrD-helicase domain-containing protein [Firmicutes bacterium]|nr:UvrD-helicase domain-containing protein [Bacillota bacterium]
MPDIDIDRTARDRIRGDIGHSFFVSAGAGSGKTTVLVDRMVKMVEEGVDISRICTITFTKAAASEFYTRFQRKLTESSSPLAREARKNIDLCFMGTIDSFCNMILSEHPMEAKIPPAAQVVTDEEMARLYRRELSRIKSGDPAGELRKKCELFESCFYKPEKAFISGMEFLAGSRNAGFRYAAVPDKGPDELFGTRRERLIDILKYISAHEEIVPDKPKDTVSAMEALRSSRSTLLDSWDGNVSSVLSALKKLAKLRIVKEFEPRMDELGPGGEDVFKPHYGKGGKVSWYEIDPDPDADPLLTKALTEYCVSAASGFFAAAYPEVSAELRKEGKLSFSDYLFYLRDLLKEDAASGGKLIRHIRERHDRFLIDEFQDTDPVQTEIFFYLSTDHPDPDWRKCVPEPGSLFIVGDPKQSIYRFKNADVSSFLRTQKLFGDPFVGEVLRLTRNFRSVPELKRWFNSAFSAMLPEDTGLQSRFEEIPMDGGPASAEPPEGRLLEGVLSYSAPSVKRVKDRTDHIKVAEIIERIVGDPELRIAARGRDGKTVYRRPSYRDIMVITPSKGPLPRYMEEMRRLRIPHRVEDKTTFSQCPALKSASRIFSAAADPFDKKAVFSASQLSGCAVDEKKLFAYYEDSKSLTPSSLFSKIVDGERVLAAAGSRNAEYLYFAMELLRAAELEEGVSSVKAAAAFIEELLSDEGQERCLQLVRAADVVHLANLHKVKGLEAPIVILADPFGGSREHRPAKRIDLSSDPPAAYLFEVGSSDYAGARTQAFAAEEEAEAQAAAAERLRLLYVAATRAMNVLVISSALKDGGEPAKGLWTPLLEFGSRSAELELKSSEELNTGTGAEAGGTPETDPQQLYDEAERGSVLLSQEPLKPSYSVIRPSTVLLRKVGEDDESEGPRDDPPAAASAANDPARPLVRRPAGFDPALAGTLAHRVMEALVSSRGAFDADELTNATLLEYAADGKLYGDMLKDMIRTMRSGGYEQQSDVPRDMLSELLSAEEVHCELPFCYSSDGESIWHGVMDAVYRKDGCWHIIDYKTSADPDDLDERYRTQLESYVDAFRAMTGEEADAKVYHLGI